MSPGTDARGGNGRMPSQPDRSSGIPVSVAAPQSVRPRPVSLAAQVESRPPASPKSVALIAFVIALMVVIGVVAFVRFGMVGPGP
jgi:hypothetical protein